MLSFAIRFQNLLNTLFVFPPPPILFKYYPHFTNHKTFFSSFFSWKCLIIFWMKIGHQPLVYK